MDEMGKKTGRIAIIDGNSLVFRAYFAIRNPMITSRGVYTHAIFGFLNMLARAMGEAEPAYLAIAFDRKAPTFRHLEYDGYKAGRAKTPDELSMQLPYLKDILAAMRICVLEADGFEADDIIGTVAKQAEEAGLSPLIITGDRDELQLVTERTSVLITKKGVSEFELNTPESMREKYGFGPESFVDYKGLMGDPSDNIPGLPGVGEKTAAKLIVQYGSIENILAHTDEVVPERLRGIIEENSQLAVMSKRLATIVTEVPVDIDFEQMRVREWDIPRLTELYTELEFRSFLKKLSAKGQGGGTGEGSGGGEAPAWEGAGRVSGFGNLGGFAGGENGVSAPAVAIAASADDDPRVLAAAEAGRAVFASCMDVEVSTIDSAFALINLREKIDAAGSAVIHLLGSEDHVDTPLVYAIFVSVNHECYAIKTFGDDDLLLAAAELLRGARAKLSGFGLQADLYKIWRGASGGVLANPVFDAGVANYLLAPSAGNATLPQIALTYAGIHADEAPDLSAGPLAVPFDAVAAYGKGFCAAVNALEPILRARLDAAGLTKLFDEVEMPLTLTLAAMEVNGFSFD
ncbi:MAG: hypothetical protein LBS85_02985, partial [Clostridiales Family XIII bacterium]|nr:hypothetical protein [Clostridiales Family XIII bacterium]